MRLCARLPAQVQINSALPAVSIHCSAAPSSLGKTTLLEPKCLLQNCLCLFSCCSSVVVTLQLGQGLLQAGLTITACPNQKAQVHDCGNAALPGRLCLLLAARRLWRCSQDKPCLSQCLGMCNTANSSATHHIVPTWTLDTRSLEAQVWHARCIRSCGTIL